MSPLTEPASCGAWAVCKQLRQERHLCRETVPKTLSSPIEGAIFLIRCSGRIKCVELDIAPDGAFESQSAWFYKDVAPGRGWHIRAFARMQEAP